MSGNAKKISELTVATTLSATDRVVVLTNPSSTANVMTITTSNFANSVAAKLISNSAPVSNTSNGTTGQIAYDGTHVYVCYQTNKWGRTELTLSW